MSRYIDADAFKKYIKDGFEIAQPRFKTEQYRKLATESTMGFLEDIDEQPTADVVEVVYCRDCIHRADIEEVNCGVCEIVHRYRKYNDYCSYGERKGGAK